jgi:aminoglycoside 6-adenylyltransferase
MHNLRIGSYSDSDIDNIWKSLFSMGSLVRRMASSVASVYGFQYPQKDDEQVTEYLHRIKNLPRDATEI